MPMATNDSSDSDPLATNTTTVSHGERLPDFTLPGGDATGIGLFRLSEFLENDMLLLGVLPSAPSSNHTQLREFSWFELSQGVNVAFAFGDTNVRQAAGYAEQFGVPILVDVHGDAIDMFGVRSSPDGPRRVVVLLDEQRRILYTEQVRPEDGFDLDALDRTIKQHTKPMTNGN